jgi:aryl-alcohol dehydrogenase-like predicted oxidoreductase
MVGLDTDVRTLGVGGVQVTSLGLGTMTFGAESDEKTAHLILDTYQEAGGTFIETADVYSEGEAERIVGRWLADRDPSDMIVGTKGRFLPQSGSSGASYRGLTKAIDASLGRLGVDAIDVYFVHAWDPESPIEDTLAALTDATRQGKILSVGWSNTTAWQFQRILDTARNGGFVVPKVFQPQYNLLDRNIEVELLPMLLDEGVSITPWSPLGGGWLTGKYRRDERPTGASRLGEDPGRGVEAYDLRNTDRTWRILDVLGDIADTRGEWMGAVAIAWLLGRPAVSSVLLGARTPEQLEQSLGAIDVDLSDEDRLRLTEVSAPGLPPYPYGFLEDLCGVDDWRLLGTRPLR